MAALEGLQEREQWRQGSLAAAAMVAMLWRVCVQRESAREGESEGGRRGDSRALGYGAAGREVARGTEVGHASAMVGRALVHGHHEVISSSTWRALLCSTWSPFLSQLCSELGYGP